jgi:hypothetical protein
MKPRSDSVSKGGKSDNCNHCNKKVKEKEKALQCEICEMWYHIECRGVSVAMYKLLIGEGKNIHWFCDNCNGAVAKIYKVVCTVQNRQDVIEDKVDKISGSLNDMKENINDTIDKRLEERKNRRRREQNLILFNVPESKSEDEDTASTLDDGKVFEEIYKDVIKVSIPGPQLRNVDA